MVCILNTFSLFSTKKKWFVFYAWLITCVCVSLCNERRVQRHKRIKPMEDVTCWMVKWLFVHFANIENNKYVPSQSITHNDGYTLTHSMHTLHVHRILAAKEQHHHINTVRWYFCVYFNWILAGPSTAIWLLFGHSPTYACERARLFVCMHIFIQRARLHYDNSVCIILFLSTSVFLSIRMRKKKHTLTVKYLK